MLMKKSNAFLYTVYIKGINIQLKIIYFRVQIFTIVEVVSIYPVLIIIL